MASFLDAFFKIFLLATQVYAVYALGELFQKIQMQTAADERDFTKKYGEHTDWMIETGKPTTPRLERFIPEFRKVQRSKQFWNGVGGNLLFIIFVLVQLVVCVGYFNVDFVSGLR